MKWEKGQSGNPSGRKKGTLRADDVAARFGDFAAKKYWELKAIADDKLNADAIDMMIAATMIRAIDKSDYAALEAILSRAIGKLKDISSIEITNTEAMQKIEAMPREQIINLLRSVG